MQKLPNGTHSKSTVEGRAAAMDFVIPESRSLVLRATHILWVHIETAQPGAWEKAPTGGVRRENQLTVRLQETLKGSTTEHPGDTVRTKILQYGTGTTRIAGVPGVWSNLSLDPGTEWVVFCHSQKTNLAELLSEPDCIRVLPKADALTDVRIALSAEADKKKLTDVLALAHPSAKSLRFVFAEYLWTRYSTTALASDADYERLITFLEDPNLSYITRSSLLNYVDAGTSDGEIVSEARVGRLAIGMFRIMGLPGSTEMHDELIETSLPNLLGLLGGGKKITAHTVFQGHEEERRKAEQVLQKYTGEAHTGPLLKWLRK